MANVMWTDLDLLAFILHFLKQFWIAARTFFTCYGTIRIVWFLTLSFAIIGSPVMLCIALVRSKLEYASVA
jgi:hypothetical protein